MARRALWVGSWCILLVVATILSWVAFLDERWIVSKSRFPPSRQVSVIREYETHPAWTAAFVFFIFAIILVLVATVLAICLCIDGIFKPHATRHKRARDWMLRWAKRLAWVATVFASLPRNIAFFLFLAMIIFPFGFDNSKALPCEYDITSEKAYHFCNPWKPGLCIYLMIVAQVFLILANCFGGCIGPETSKSADVQEYREEKKEAWYDGGVAAGPMVSETSIDREVRRRESRRRSKSEIKDKSSSRRNTHSAMTNGAYQEQSGAAANGRSSNLAMINDGYLEDVVEADGRPAVLLNNASYEEHPLEHADGYLDVEQPQGKAPPAGGVTHNDGYLDVDQPQDKSHPAGVAHNDGYLDVTEPQAAAHTDGYLDVTQPESNTARLAKTPAFAPERQAPPPPPPAAVEHTDGYLDFDEEPIPSEATPLSHAGAAASLAAPAPSKSPVVHETGYLDLDGEPAETPAPVNQDNADDAYLEMAESQMPGTEEQRGLVSGKSTFSRGAEEIAEAEARIDEILGRARAESARAAAEEEATNDGYLDVGEDGPEAWAPPVAMDDEDVQPLQEPTSPAPPPAPVTEAAISMTTEEQRRNNLVATEDIFGDIFGGSDEPMPTNEEQQLQSLEDYADAGADDYEMGARAATSFFEQGPAPEVAAADEGGADGYLEFIEDDDDDADNAAGDATLMNMF
ncbi:uncharacterized protein MONBRDRAFT_29901 [Monosiga brevicollis MX1]|uniref:Uncharacterized protein n=1 Tax=Monosiga brevicollis TaxID=81824 RepID=A9VCG4_MONBE|nr:uncharacterized protein MONBRDRAFT_29901 [Monosiga brevicollis MX1]EDQ84780.1 predicted protein [Monosiga brevicollis MX1]|eukprot:XP_001750430.1 hypothetical protein [Monosiga brevicollis MX1]